MARQSAFSTRIRCAHIKDRGCRGAERQLLLIDTNSVLTAKGGDSYTRCFQLLPH